MPERGQPFFLSERAVDDDAQHPKAGRRRYEMGLGAPGVAPHAAGAGGCRAREAGKRGRSLVRVTFDEARVADTRREDAPDVLALDAALTALAAVDERKAKVVELRFFGGLTVEETAEILSVSAQTVVRDWSTAKLWLRRELSRRAKR